jgi:hypothetical protein
MLLVIKLSLYMFRPMTAIFGKRPTFQRKCFTYITCMSSCVGYTSKTVKTDLLKLIHTRQHECNTRVCEAVPLRCWSPSEVCGIACLLVFCWIFPRPWRWRRCSSETSVGTKQTTRRHISEDDTLHNHRCKNLKSYILKVVLQKSV